MTTTNIIETLWVNNTDAYFGKGMHYCAVHRCSSRLYAACNFSLTRHKPHNYLFRKYRPRIHLHTPKTHRTPLPSETLSVAFILSSSPFNALQAEMVQINDIKGDARQNRTAAHSHIKGLGLRSDGYADKVSGGFVGQSAAREVSFLYLRAMRCL